MFLKNRDKISQEHVLFWGLSLKIGGEMVTLVLSEHDLILVQMCLDYKFRLSSNYFCMYMSHIEKELTVVKTLHMHVLGFIFALEASYLGYFLFFCGFPLSI